MRMRRAFTLVELIVTIGIVALLAGILLPVMSRARARSQRVTCRAQLRDVGASFAMYMTDSKGRLPAVNVMPSLRPPLTDGPSLPQLLRPYVKSATGVFRCPGDRIVTGASAAHPVDTYFEREGASYQYSPFMAQLAGTRPQEALASKMGHPELVTIIDEYEPFHGKPGTPGSMNHLFMDMHVGSLGE